HAPTPELYSLSLHDALPISAVVLDAQRLRWRTDVAGGGDESLQHGASAPGFTTALLVEQFGFGRGVGAAALGPVTHRSTVGTSRSEEHTSELQSRENLVCRL